MTMPGMHFTVHFMGLIHTASRVTIPETSSNSKCVKQGHISLTRFVARGQTRVQFTICAAFGRHRCCTGPSAATARCGFHLGPNEATLATRRYLTTSIARTELTISRAPVTNTMSTMGIVAPRNGSTVEMIFRSGISARKTHQRSLMLKVWIRVAIRPARNVGLPVTVVGEWQKTGGMSCTRDESTAWINAFQLQQHLDVLNGEVRLDVGCGCLPLTGVPSMSESERTWNQWNQNSGTFFFNV